MKSRMSRSRSCGNVGLEKAIWKSSWQLLFLIAFCVFHGAVRAESVVPPKPTTFVTDQAGILKAGEAEMLNHRLAEYERSTSTQILIAFFNKIPENEVLEDYSVKVFDAWMPGQKGKDNGLIFFVFVQDHKMRLQVGYGLEPKLPDSVCRRILDEQAKPAFKQNAYADGVNRSLDVMEKALAGEYVGTGRTVNDTGWDGGSIFIVALIGIVLLVVLGFWFWSIGRVYQSAGAGEAIGYIFSSIFQLLYNILLMILSSSSSGGGRSGGGGSSDGYSGGGGRTGGGGASGDW